MFKDIEVYMKLLREERRAHLQLDEPCILIGGRSKEFRGLLAHFLQTTIPRGHLYHLCHACNKEECSNPRHLYWGTSKDNFNDQVAAGTYTSFKERLENKYTPEQLAEIRQRSGRKRGSYSKERISERADEFREYFSKAERSRGWITKASTDLGISTTHVRRLAERY
jgi:hypothetical protein